jgi:hypothetical protein
MQAGDTVHINPSLTAGRSAAWAVQFGGRDLVIQEMPGKGCKNAVVKIKDAPPGTRGLRIPPSDLVAGPFDAKAAYQSILSAPLPEILEPGTVVRFKRPTKAYLQGIFTVATASSDGKHQCRQLGGSAEWVRSVLAKDLIVITLPELAALLAKQYPESVAA